MARLTPDQWQQARQRWEADPVLTHEALAAELGIARPTVSIRAKAEGWCKVGALRQIAERAQLVADGKATEATEATGVASKRLTATVNESVDIRADVLDRHRSDWAEHRKLFALKDIKEKFETGKQAKISAEMVLIRQKGERAAYGLEETGGGPPPGSTSELLAALVSNLPN